MNKVKNLFNARWMSSLIFLTVLILLLIVNIGQIKQDRKNKN